LLKKEKKKKNTTESSTNRLDHAEERISGNEGKLEKILH
jgi:hypothetical protein